VKDDRKHVPLEEFDLIEVEDETSRNTTDEIANDEDLLFNFVNSTAVEKQQVEITQESIGTFSNSNFAMFGSASY
jgi:hypothetical protein